MIYSEEIARVATGDSITWIPTTKGQNVEMIFSPNDMKFQSKNIKGVKIIFEDPDPYLHWHTPHKGMRMSGLIVASGDTSNADSVANAKANGKSKEKLKKLLGEL